MTYDSYSDTAIMRALLTKDFSTLGNTFEDNIVTKIKPGAFYQASNLNTVKLPNVTEIGSYAFSGCSASITLTWAAITKIGSLAFFECNSLPSSLTLSQLTVLGTGAFAGTSSNPNVQLQSISIPLWTGATGGTDHIAAFSTGTFAYCTALTSVSLPELIATTSKMFDHASNIETIRLPKVIQLGNTSFTGCTKLKTVEIGGEITALSGGHFAQCPALESLILRGITVVPTITASFFSGTTIANGTGYVYVPKSLEATIKVASNWSNYAAQIRAIEDYDV